ncbi:hypothetical protein KDL29_09565 [bacterium]|nr:hypothetical protein [bacterium]
MLRRRLAYIIPSLTLVMTAMLFIACGGNGGPIQQEQLNAAPQVDRQLPLQEQVAEGAGLPLADGDAGSNLVTLRTPALAELGPGDEFTATLSVDLSDEVHQGVLRLMFDSLALQPVEVVPGAMLPSGMVRIADLDKPGFIPLAFTALPGGTDVAAGSGELFSIRFRLLKAGNEAGRISFISDNDFLQLRDRDGERLRFNLGTEAGGSDVK